MTKPTKRATVADVARASGTSTAVVSYVLNDGPRPVAAATRARVEAAIQQLGFRKNPIAGALISGSSNLVGLVVPDSSNAFFGEISRAFEQEGRRHGLLTLLGNTAYDPATQANYESLFSDMRPRGIFVTSIAEKTPIGEQSRIIYIHSEAPATSMDSVVFNNFGASYAATQHLIDHRYRRIVCISGPEGRGPESQREAGFRSVMEEHGRPTEIVRVPYDRVLAAEALAELLSKKPGWDAIHATTDEQGLAVLRAASDLGLRVPHDLAVIGLDGIREALHGRQPMSTFALPIGDMARAAFELLSHTDPPARRIQLEGTLMVGATCGEHDEAGSPLTR